jgi:hypothetical protein
LDQPPWRRAPASELNGIHNGHFETNNNSLLTVSKEPTLVESPEAISPKSSTTDNEKENIQVGFLITCENFPNRVQNSFSAQTKLKITLFE